MLDFFTSGPEVEAIADSAATVGTSFIDLTMSWIDGQSLNSLVSAAGVDTLTTIFDMTYPIQQLRFDWTDSAAGQDFRFDVEAAVTAVPVPAPIFLIGAALAGLGLVGRRNRRGAVASA